MDLARALTELWQRKLLLVVGAVVGIVAALLTAFSVSGFPPKIEKKSLEFGTAQTRLLVDAPESPIANLKSEFAPLSARAAIYARLVESATVKRFIGERMNLPPEAIAAGTTGATAGATEQTKGRETSATVRAQELVGESVGYRISATAPENFPFVGIIAQAPSAKEAAKLANATADSLREYITRLQDGQNVPAANRARIKQPGEAQGALVNQGVDKQMMVLAFVGLFGLWCMGILLLVHMRESQRERKAEEAFRASLDGGGHGAVDPDGRVGEPQRPLVHP